MQQLRNPGQIRTEILAGLTVSHALVPEAGPSAEEVQRIEDLQFDLGQLEEAFDEAERKYQAYSHDPEATGEGHDNG